MPELPEVETIRGQLESVVRGRVVVAAGSHPSAKFSSAVDVIGCRITDVGRRGKYLILATDCDVELIVHLGMTGYLDLQVQPSESAVTRGPHVRAWWHLDDGSTLCLTDMRRFGRVAVVPTGDHRSLPTLDHLGVEPFTPDFTAAHLHRALGASHRAVKTQLLGQRVVAGVGNIYADEALWRARINPGTRRVGLDRCGPLRDAIVGALQDGLAHGGTRLRDYRTMDGDTGGHQYHLDCYGRAGEPCNRCGEPLRHRVLDGRGTTWCGTCQAR